MIERMAKQFSHLTYEIVTPGTRATSLDWAATGILANTSQRYPTIAALDSGEEK
jgi:hypothetical protein